MSILSLPLRDFMTLKESPVFFLVNILPNRVDYAEIKAVMTLQKEVDHVRHYEDSDSL